MIGLERGIVRLAPYTAEWKWIFEEEKARLETAVGAYVLDIQHVGSTSRHPEVAKEYTALKMRLAEQYPTDRDTYLEGKAPFIEDVLRKARHNVRSGRTD